MLRLIKHKTPTKQFCQHAGALGSNTCTISGLKFSKHGTHKVRPAKGDVKKRTCLESQKTVHTNSYPNRDSALSQIVTYSKTTKSKTLIFQTQNFFLLKPKPGLHSCAAHPFFTGWKDGLVRNKESIYTELTENSACTWSMRWDLFFWFAFVILFFFVVVQIGCFFPPFVQNIKM